jgi:hypothetical protein
MDIPDELRLYGTQGNNGHTGETRRGMFGRADRLPPYRIDSGETDTVSQKEITTILKIAFVGAVVAVAVSYFIEPAAKNAVKMR